MLVPTIDLKAAEKDVTALTPLDAACRDHGFFLLSNHGMDAAIEQMWSAASGFFDQPSEVKRGGIAHRKYSAWLFRSGTDKTKA